MPINVGYIEGTLEGIVVRVYYDETQPAGDTQPLIDGPRGYCLDITNTTNRVTDVTLTTAAGGDVTIRLGKGDPVESGPPAGRSRTAAQVASLGYTTRGDVTGFRIV